MRTTFVRLAFACALIFALGACATGGAKYQDMASSMPKLKVGDGRVYFLRSASIVGAAIQPDIRLNGQVVGSSKPGGFFYVDRPAGTYKAATATETENAASFALGAGETKYLRTSPALGVFIGRIVVELESPDKAKAELASLHYTGS
jgi:hypothetical protein